MTVTPLTTVFRCLLSSPALSSHSHNLPLTLPFDRTPLFRSLLLPSRRRTLCPALAAANNKNKSNKNKKKLLRDHGTKGSDEDEEEDAFELLFKQLEEDLKKDNLLKGGSNDDDDDEITEEELALLERELEGALGEFDAETLNPDVIHAETDASDSEEEQEEEEDDEEDGVPMLRTWQMKKLARALKAGRRKTSIKNLAAELCLDRAFVIELLRNPPPNLLMMSLSISDEPTPKEISVETKPREIVLEETRTDPVEAGNKANVPVHVMQQKWSAQKRLKRAQVDTLEKVYRRSKRPTNAMISSIVHVTNIPRRRVVKWFEDKRAEEGVPENRVPYQRSVSEAS
ncbi:hypothetical protein HN51_045661 [Arachis hypogaea]|uniref:Homeobox domain-containing protein n=1 Tax=Arachis hypogaea TaxID=3818 RepID=A0A444XXW6_ARAHY|nr:protein OVEREXPRESSOR OF CATIONIC PEROXIDASE 3 [Arachis ipaensis]QHN97960.1 Protein OVEREXPRESSOR OF CATIONIC PEROXIDASE [Arachis hypogaea]RYQ94515.1 hypothetical protein Ahy_B08g089432 [Arachis hypogaea]